MSTALSKGLTLRLEKEHTHLKLVALSVTITPADTPSKLLYKEKALSGSKELYYKTERFIAEYRGEKK